jgi:hydrogenase nickel incorporation protein HypA/HybF
MHELGVVFHVIKMVDEVAAENNLTQVESVTLELGEVSTVIESYLQNCWKWAVANRTEIMKDAKLLVETIPAVTYCEDCEKTYETVAHGKICPYCKSEHTYLIQGNEFNIKEIEGC